MSSRWRHLPVIVRAVLVGLVVAAVGNTPWGILVSANSKYWSAVPSAVPPTALYLWLFWRYVGVTEVLCYGTAVVVAPGKPSV